MQDYERMVLTSSFSITIGCLVQLAPMQAKDSRLRYQPHRTSSFCPLSRGSVMAAHRAGYGFLAQDHAAPAPMR
jgi:hypothetical protein